MRLYLRIETPVGPRTLISSGHDSVVAHAIKFAIEAANPAGNYAEVTEDGSVKSMAEHIRKLKMDHARKAKKAAAASNVTVLRTARKAR